MPLTISIDTNLFYDKAEGREGASDFDAILELARNGKFQLFFTATTDFEDRSGAATQLVVRLRKEGILWESANAGTTQRDFMPGGSGFHRVDITECEELMGTLWPDERWRGASKNKRSDVLHLIAHIRNGHDIFLTRDKELLSRKQIIKDKFKINIKSPMELLSTN